MAITIGMDASIILDMHEVPNIYQTGDTEGRALWQVNFVFFESEFVVLLGPSGSGK